jgi:hypothetical protein
MPGMFSELFRERYNKPDHRDRRNHVVYRGRLPDEVTGKEIWRKVMYAPDGKAD